LTDRSAPSAEIASTASHSSANDEHVENNVFDRMVLSEDDFLGLLSYSVYKRHKIEWLRADKSNSAEEFKKVACTQAQMLMYRFKAEQLAKELIDISMAELGEKMRLEIQSEELILGIAKCNPPFWSKVGHHFLGGLASALVAVALLGFYSLYANWQNVGGVEGAVKALVKVPADAPSKPAIVPEEKVPTQ
jgi:hypothetical protein